VDNRRAGFGGEQNFGAQTVARIKPTVGVHGEYTIKCGDDHVLGRYDMLRQNAYISRVSGLVKVENDGTTHVTAMGKLAMVVRPPGGTWSVLSMRQTHVLTDGTQISLKANEPEDAIFTVYIEDENGQRAQGGNGQQNGMQQNGMQQNGMQQNGMQQNGMQQNGMQQNGMQQNGMQQNGMQQNGQNGMQSGQNPFGMQNGLPNGWHTSVDEGSGQTYYYNELTGQTQWEPPS